MSNKNNKNNITQLLSRRDATKHKSLSLVSGKDDGAKPFYAQTILPYIAIFPDTPFIDDISWPPKYNKDRHADETVGPCHHKYFKYGTD